MTAYDIHQTAVFVLGVACAMCLVIGTRRSAFWGSALGLASEPFWLWAGVDSGQWAVILLAVIFSIVYGWGVWHNLRSRP